MTGEPDVAQAARNLADSLARLKESTVGYGRGKLDDLRDSAESELRRRLTVAVGAVALGLLGFLGIVFGAVAIILAFGDSHPALAAAGVAAGFFLLAGLSAWMMARAHRRRSKSVARVASLAGLLLRFRRAAR